MNRGYISIGMSARNGKSSFPGAYDYAYVTPVYTYTCQSVNPPLGTQRVQSLTLMLSEWQNRPCRKNYVLL